MALVIRAELFQPGLQFVNPQFFNQMTTMHGADHGVRRDHAGLRRLRELDDPAADRRADMALPRMNNFSFWLLPSRLHAAAGSFFMPGGAPAGGWTLYPPLTLQAGPSMDAGSSRCT
jgi:cytochrome c oxidase subunit 1